MRRPYLGFLDFRVDQEDIMMERTTAKLFILIISGLVLTGLCLSDAAALELTSSSFNDGDSIPVEHTCFGKNINPPLSWKDVPEGTKSFVVMVTDPDAPMGTWIHWVVYNIPGGSTGLKAGLPRDAELEDGIRQGMTSFRKPGYGGPCPPPGPAHRYRFFIYAIDTLLDFPAGAGRNDVLRQIQGHILDRDILTGRFKRP